MDHLTQDLRYAIRMLRKSPVTTLVAIVSFALGIGANSAIFSLMSMLLLRPLPVRQPSQLASITTTTPQDPNGYPEGLSLSAYQAIRKSELFSDLFAFTYGGLIGLEAQGVKYVSSPSTVTGEYFSTLGVHPIMGRAITPTDLNLDSGVPAAVAVVSYGCWQRRYSGSADVLGKTILIEGHPQTIIGVMGETFTGTSAEVVPEVIVPIGYSGRSTYRSRKTFGLDVVARLKAGVTIEQANAKLQGMWPAILEHSLPSDISAAQREEFLRRRLGVSSAAKGESYLRGKFGPGLQILMVMVGLLLLISCANLANLMIARAAGRRGEFGIRVALGAGRWRLLRLMQTESLLLTSVGALLGLAWSFWVSRLLLSMVWVSQVPMDVDPTPDARVVLFTIGVSLLTGILFGMAPAIRIFRENSAPAMLQYARSVRGVGIGRTLIASQVALSLVLVAGAVLFVRSLEKLQSTDLGFKRDNVLTVLRFHAPGQSQAWPDRVAYHRELTDRLRAIPGVDGVSFSHMGPVSPSEYVDTIAASSSPTQVDHVVYEAVGPGFFQLMHMRVLAGREFDWRDDDKAPGVAILSESVARRLFPSINPIGQRIDFDDRKGLEVIGVVNSASLWKPQSHEPSAAYVALMQKPSYNGSPIDIRTAGDPKTIVPDVRRVLEGLGRQSILRAETLDERTSRVMLNERMIAMCSAFFGGLALLLASIGIYGLMAHAVARRTSEIGLRMALGARASEVVGLVIKEVLWMVGAGVAVGVPATLMASRFINGMLYGMTGSDPSVILVSCSILAAAAMLAAFVPARRAARIDPMKALRVE